MNTKTIENAYKTYFSTDSLPRKHNGPKDLLAHILLDFELKRHQLPLSFGERIRQQKNSPSYFELVYIINQLSQGNATFIDAIREYENWGRGLGDKQLGQYWGSVYKILLVSARDWQAFESLKLGDDAKNIIRSYSASSDEINDAGGKAKFLQAQSEKLQKIIPQFVGRVFHIQNTQGVWQKPTEQEINILLYVARNSTYATEDHLLNQALRPYYKSRLQGESATSALHAYQQHFAQLEGMQERLDALKNFLDSSSTGLRGPSALQGRVFLSGMNLADQERLGQWTDAIRHLWELGATLPSGETKGSLSTILSEISKNKTPNEQEYGSYLQQIQAWMTSNADHITMENRALFDTIQNHLNEVKRLTEEKSTNGSPSDNSSKSSHPPMLDVSIQMETDPIGTLHLGWPRLGGSCLDCVGGSYQQYAAGYVLNPSVRVVYIRDKKNPEKPLARVSVALDPTSKTLFVLSPTKTSGPYEYQPLLGQFLSAWAKELGVSVIAPSSLGYGANLGSSFQQGTKTVSLTEGLAPFYADLTGQGVRNWNGTVNGMVLNPSPSLASIADQSLRSSGFDKKHPVLYTLYTVFFVNWEVVFQLVIPLALKTFGPSWEIGLLALAVSATLFSVAHPEGRKGKFSHLFLVGLAFGGPFLFPSLGFSNALLISMALHSLYNSAKLSGWFPSQWPLARILIPSKLLTLTRNIFPPIKNVTLPSNSDEIKLIAENLVDLALAADQLEKRRTFSGDLIGNLVSLSLEHDVHIQNLIGSNRHVSFGLLMTDPRLNESEFFTVLENVVTDRIAKKRLSIDQVAELLQHLALLGLPQKSLDQIVDTVLETVQQVVVVTNGSEDDGKVRAIIKLVGNRRPIKIFQAAKATDLEGRLILSLVNSSLKQHSGRGLENTLLILPEGMRFKSDVPEEILRALIIATINDLLQARLLTGPTLINIDKVARIIAQNA